MRALEGLKVLDFAWVIAGPVIGRALADFGATVVRIDSSKRLDLMTRHSGPFHDGKSDELQSMEFETGKLGLSLDLSRRGAPSCSRARGLG